jgi:uncharacterized protein DUF7007
MSERTDCAQSRPMTAAQLKRLRNGLPDGCPLHSPWGAVQHGEKLADEDFFVSTAGHGGIKLAQARNASIPDVFRKEGGWYEEDCDWAIPMDFLKLDLAKRDIAIATLKNWHWKAYESWFKEIIPPGSSFLKDEHLFQEANRANWVVISASGDWHEKVPEGMVGCVATLGGRRGDGRSPRPAERNFLVPADEYAKRDRFGFVIDESRDQPWL